MININNILTQLNAKMAADIADSYNIPELVRRVEAYQKLNVDAGTVPEYSSYNELPDSDSANIGQIVYVRQKPGSRGDFDNDTKDSAGTFFFGKRAGGTTIGWQKIPLLEGDSDYADIAAGGGASNTQGSSFAYASGGSPSPMRRTIEKFAFGASATIVDVGDLLTDTRGHSGTSSTTHGYTAGGGGSPSYYDGRTVIEKFSFSVDGNATDVGDLAAAVTKAAGQESATNGYTAGGVAGSPVVTSAVDSIEKYPFAADANATDVGDLTVTKYERAGQSSTTHGYVSGGFQGQDPYIVDVIEKFSFSVDGNATDVGDLTVARHVNGGNQSSTHGYTAGGNSGPPAKRNEIDKFTFSSDGNATDVGDLTVSKDQAAGSSSTEHGYVMGGRSPSASDIIERFAFATDGNATDIGDLSNVNSDLAGHQV